MVLPNGNSTEGVKRHVTPEIALDSFATSIAADMGYWLLMGLPAAAPIRTKSMGPVQGDPPAPYPAYLLRYLALLLSPVFVLMLVTFPWTRYVTTAPGKWMLTAMDFRYQVRNVNADVVIFGDSTGLVGLDPSLMQPELHLTVVNLASLASIFSVQLDQILDEYLRSNKPPKLILVSLSPWNLRQEQITPSNSFEGIVMLTRHGTWPQILRFIVAHPLVAVSFEFQVLQSLLNPLHHANVQLQQELVEHSGFARLTLPPLQPPCRLLKPYTDPEVQDGLAVHFHQKYSSPHTQVLIYMAPVADCAGSEQFAAPHPHSPWLVPSAVIPAIDICQDGIHLEDYAVGYNSQAADKAIAHYLALNQP